MTGTGPWTAMEDELVRGNYPGHGAHWDMWALVLPGRTPAAIQQRASRLGVRELDPPGEPGDGWTDAQRRELLLALLQASRATGRSPTSCLAEMERMAIWRNGGASHG